MTLAKLLVEMEMDTGNHPPPHSIQTIHTTLKTPQMGTKRSTRNTRMSRYHRKKHFTMDLTSSYCPHKNVPGKPPRRRVCVDYRRINKLQLEVTKADRGKGCISLIPLPKIDELYTKLKSYKVFSSLDLRSGYYHIGLSESAKPKSAFVLSSLGKYQFNRVPFGLAQAPAYFQKLINIILEGCNFAMGYLDNIIIYNRSETEHWLSTSTSILPLTPRGNIQQVKSSRTET